MDIQNGMIIDIEEEGRHIMTEEEYEERLGYLDVQKVRENKCQQAMKI